MSVICFLLSKNIVAIWALMSTYTRINLIGLLQTLKDSAPIYRDALIASVLVNLFALVSPLFIMNVYDKVVPNLAFDSLWVLAIGAGIAYIFDLIMRQLRSYLIDVAGKKVDIYCLIKTVR